MNVPDVPTTLAHAAGNRTPLRIAIVQLRPKIGQVKENIQRARELCSKLQPHSIDILCFPEMAFTGYAFESAKSIIPYLEEPRTGHSSLFFQETAKNLGCYVIGGYPERLAEEETKSQSDDRNNISNGGMEVLPAISFHQIIQETSATPITTKPLPHVRVGANSAVLFGPSGQWLCGYRKTNLFDTDMTWAKPGSGFTSFSLNLSTTQHRASNLPEGVAANPPIITVSLGICMDLNTQPPASWSIANGPYELADYSVKNASRLLILLNAWLYSGRKHGEVEADSTDGADSDENGLGEDAADDEPDWQTLNYWAERLRPLWTINGRRRGSNETIYSQSSSDTSNDAEKTFGETEEDKPPHETIVVICNRTGKENGTTFAGSSAIFSMRTGAGRPKLLDMMGRHEEGVRVWNLSI